MGSVIFFMLYDIDDLTFNNTKLLQQMQAAERMGYDVYYLGYSKTGIYLCNNKDREFVCKTINVNKNFLKRIQIFRAMLKVLENHIFDCCYTRKMITTVNYGRCLKRMNRKGIKLTVEIPTYPDYAEFKKDKRKLRRIAFCFLKFIDKHYAKYVNLFTLIGEKSVSYFNVRAINIDNGIDINSVSPWQVYNKKNDIHILVIANFCYWHGYERLIYGLKKYYYEDDGKLNIFVHMVGPDEDGSLDEWMAMAKKYNLGEHFITEGSLYGKQLDVLANKCSLAMAGLGLYKKELYNASELKVLNYCARGIPFIYCSESFENSDIRDLCMKIENSSEPIDINEILRFYDSVILKEDISNRLRTYCSQNYSWETQLKKVFRELGFDV